MKRILPLIFLAMTIIASNAQEIDKMALRMAIERQLSIYPESTLQDVYKNFYQEYFGPEHMISDTAAVRNYLDYELTHCDDQVGHLYYEPIGIDGDYVRVYLNSVTRGLIDAEELLRAFIDSASARHSHNYEWEDLWNTIVEIIDEIRPGFGTAERKELQQASHDKQAVHHSKNYNEAYHPHYRIVERTIFEMLLKPSIDL